jgi:hypothetical protein
MTTQEQDEFYGQDAADWLRRWDEGKTVWSIEMGGLGPGYEQCIAILTAEILRIYLDKKYDFDAAEKDELIWNNIRKERDEILFSNKVVSDLGVSGAQMGAAANLAGHLYRRGPVAVMNDPEVKDRHIQISRQFPQTQPAVT